MVKKKTTGIKDTAIIKNIALCIYKKNKKQNGYEILQNYLLGSNSNLKNKYKVEQILKTINKELGEAKNQFNNCSKLILIQSNS